MNGFAKVGSLERDEHFFQMVDVRVITFHAKNPVPKRLDLWT